MTYKFRGKRKDNGEWVYGFYLTYGKVHAIIPLESFSYADNGGALDFDYVEVIPGTVGQYIGREDVSWQEIYQGDRVGAFLYDIEITGVIAWIGTGFYISDRPNSGYPFTMHGIHGIKVIGTIHDEVKP